MDKNKLTGEDVMYREAVRTLLMSSSLPLLLHSISAHVDLNLHSSAGAMRAGQTGQTGRKLSQTFQADDFLTDITRREKSKQSESDDSDHQRSDLRGF